MAENEEKKYLDYDGLNYYNEKIKEYIDNLLTENLEWGTIGQE